ncbi:MAG: uncharacterized protein K0S76_984 [Herbinix sp.]|jgi:hypothetical protein|nr:uncharacterized protein [Herbinix sp.]
MKKLLTLLLALTLVMTMFTACGKKNEGTPDTDPTTAPTEAPADDADPTEAPADDAAATATAKTGLAIVTALGKSKNAAADADGLAEVDSTVVAVLVGEDGKIVDCKIDVAQTKMNFNAEGKLTTDIATKFKSKQELGAEYGMVGKSDIGKEWNEQANAFATYVIGKTIDEVKGIALNEEGKTTDADLASSVTVHVNEFIDAIDKAVASAQNLGASSTDKLGLGISTDMAKSKDATAEADGLAQAYSHYVVTTTDAAGKITSCVIDASQGNVNFNATGVVTTDLTVAPESKQVLKDAYGMKAKSGISKEWYEQANAFATYVTGKTLDEVNGIAMTDGYATDADLLSSVTVHINAFVEVINKAVAQ